MAYEWLTARTSRNFESRRTTSKHGRWLKFYSESSTLSLAASGIVFDISQVIARAQISPGRLLVSINSVVEFADLPPFLSSAKIDIYSQPRINAHKRSSRPVYFRSFFARVVCSSAPSLSSSEFSSSLRATPPSNIHRFSLRRLNEIITWRLLLLFIADSKS